MLEKKLQEAIDRMWDAREDAQYDGDYSVTLIIEGEQFTMALEDIQLDLIADEELLIHLNVINSN